jgi:putative FmdB family regulatory protein
MPMYDFSCHDCASVFEELLTQDADPVVCPQCGSSKATRMVSAPSPLKTGAFPFKPGPVHPMASRMAGGSGGCAGGGCASGGAFS